MKYVETGADASEGRIPLLLGGPNNDPTSISKGMELAPRCEREVSAARR